MPDLINREDAITALNNCIDIKGYAYTSMHDALMEIKSVNVLDTKALKEELKKAPVWTSLSVIAIIDKMTKTQIKTQNSNLTFEKQTNCAWAKGE